MRLKLFALACACMTLSVGAAAQAEVFDLSYAGFVEDVTGSGSGLVDGESFGLTFAFDSNNGVFVEDGIGPRFYISYSGPVYTAFSTPTTGTVSSDAAGAFVHVDSIDGDSGEDALNISGTASPYRLAVSEVLTEDFFGNLVGGPTGQLTGPGYSASLFIPGAPEPTTWSMLIGGLGIVGSVLRLQSRAIRPRARAGVQASSSSLRQ